MTDENGRMLPEGISQNLSDFVLFQSVMKRKEAHEIILSVIMEDPHLVLKEIHVEEVVLNKCQKRAIRLDAWAKDLYGNQYNTEMQNDTKKDDMRKRSRFYQSLIDSPILKSGQETRYKHLPETVVIFITQEDIFGEDLVKYTFTEQCEEVEGLHLADGTKKKVKESEEWEELHMSIYSVGVDIGKGIGEESKLLKQICKKLRKGKTEEVIADELEEDIGFVRKIINCVAQFAPKYDEDAALSAWMQVRENI